MRPPSERDRPLLLFFYSPRSGRCRRVEAFLAQILQRRQNHHTFALRRIDVDARPELAERFGVAHVPVLVVVAEQRVRRRLDHVRGCQDIDAFLSPWLKR